MASLTSPGTPSQRGLARSHSEDTAKLVRKRNGGAGFYGVIDFVGSPATFKLVRAGERRARQFFWRQVAA